MSLPLPRLDTRDFDQLVDEARESLPARAPEWTDHNFSDPGITLLELFAYLTEIGLYRLDRVPDSSRRAFLRLLGTDVEPARVAHTVATFAQGAGSFLHLPPRLQLASTDDAVAFQTTASVDVIQTRLTALLARHDGNFADLTTGNDLMDPVVQPFGSRPVHGDALYLGFTPVPGPEGACLRLFVFGESISTDAEVWRALAADAREARRAGRDLCGTRMARAVGRFWRHYDARLVWEYFDATGDWRPLPHVRDRTRALTISGPVAIRLPKPSAQAIGGVASHPGQFFIRARFADGEYDCPPSLRGVRINATIARHAVDTGVVEPTTGVGFGRANESSRLQARPIVAGSARVVVTTPAGDVQTWTEVLDWDRSGPFDRHYRLDPLAGTVTFGNGRAGRVPPAGAAITATYQVGGGVEGNVPAGTLIALRQHGPNLTLADWPAIAANITIAQPLAAVGGAPAMTIDSAEGRAVRLLERARAAVTPADLVRVATSVAGVPVARAYALPGVHPVASCLSAPGCVTVVVVPACVDARPQPSPALLREIAAALDRRRPLATEIHVIGPRYTTVTIRARLRLAVRGSRSTTADAARAALDRFFHPLRGGAAGQGWPVGRSVYRSEVLALLAGLPGVAHVTDLEIVDCPHAGGRCGNLEICPDGLITSGPHRIVIE